MKTIHSTVVTPEHDGSDPSTTQLPRQFHDNVQIAALRLLIILIEFDDFARVIVSGALGNMMCTNNVLSGVGSGPTPEPSPFSKGRFGNCVFH